VRACHARRTNEDVMAEMRDEERREAQHRVLYTSVDDYDL
jgi:hypothetical protein